MLSALLGLESRATILENPNISLRDPAVWQQIFGDYSGTESGVAVSERCRLICTAADRTSARKHGRKRRITLHIGLFDGTRIQVGTP